MKPNNKKVVVLITAVLLISILALSVYQQTTEHVEELTYEKIIIHYGDGETKILTSEMPEFREMGNISLRVIKSINMQLRMPVPADLKERNANNIYVEIIFPETVNISTKYGIQPNIELDAALIMLTGEYSSIIFTGKRGYINWTDDTGYFVENRSKNVLYRLAWESAVNVDGLRDIVERLKYKIESQ